MAVHGIGKLQFCRRIRMRKKDSRLILPHREPARTACFSFVTPRMSTTANPVVLPAPDPQTSASRIPNISSIVTRISQPLTCGTHSALLQVQAARSCEAFFCGKFLYVSSTSAAPPIDSCSAESSRAVIAPRPIRCASSCEPEKTASRPAEHQAGLDASSEVRPVFVLPIPPPQIARDTGLASRGCGRFTMTVL